MPGKWSAPRLRRHSSRHDRRAEPCQGTGNLAAIPDSLCGGDVTDHPTAPLVGVPLASQKRQQGEKPRAVKDSATLGEGPAMLPFPRPRGWQLPTVLLVPGGFVGGRALAVPRGREPTQKDGKFGGALGRHLGAVAAWRGWGPTGSIPGRTGPLGVRRISDGFCKGGGKCSLKGWGERVQAAPKRRPGPKAGLLHTVGCSC